MATNMKWYGKDFKDDLNKVIRAKLTTCGEIIISDAQASMREPKTGRKGKVRTASAPGESPAVQMAILKESLAQEPLEDIVGVRVGTNEKHGLYMELGTRGRAIKPKKGKQSAQLLLPLLIGRILPRPWLRPALDRSTKAIRVVFSKI